MNHIKPLTGIKVLELASYIAGPTCGMLLANWGAEVIKLESLKGDEWRISGVYYGIPVDENEVPFFDVCNANKKSISLDLKSEGGMEVFQSLLQSSDVFVTNLRPASLSKMKIGYDDIKESCPRLIYASLTGYGENGPFADAPGFDAVSFWARSGFLVDQADPSGYPVVPPSGFGDASTGTTLFGAICASLLGREKTGCGDYLSISLFGTALWFASLQIILNQERYGDYYPKKRLEINPFECAYRCSDGEWMMLAFSDYDMHVAPLFKILGMERELENPNFASMELCMINRAALILRLEEAFQAHSSGELARIFAEEKLVFDLMGHYRNVPQDVQALANRYIQNLSCPSGAEVAVSMPPVKSQQLGEYVPARGPFLGEDTRALLEKLGYGEDKIDNMLENKIAFQHEHRRSEAPAAQHTK